jgi:predicted phosphoadenosine phosphosulfate sulfurtransferase
MLRMMVYHSKVRDHRLLILLKLLNLQLAFAFSKGKHPFLRLHLLQHVVRPEETGRHCCIKLSVKFVESQYEIVFHVVDCAFSNQQDQHMSHR